MKVKNSASGGATRIPGHLPPEAIPIGLLGKIAVRCRGTLKDDTAGKIFKPWSLDSAGRSGG